nr:uncharacterized protein LOC111420381 [Onthophagus taurus]
MAASSLYEDDTSDSNLSQDGIQSSFDSLDLQDSERDFNVHTTGAQKNLNLIHKLNLRQIYGRVTRNPRAKTEKLVSEIHSQCKFQLSKLIEPEALNHIFMGFTLCGQYVVSFMEKYVEGRLILLPDPEYELYIWRFVPGKRLRLVAKYPIFKLLQGQCVLREIVFMQFPTDPFRLICYGSGSYSMIDTTMAFLTILTLPSPDNCKYCKLNNKFEQGWCLRHGFMMHYSFSLNQSYTQGHSPFDPHISLAYPDHFVINTGANIHILNVQCAEPPKPNFIPPVLEKECDKNPTNTFADNASEASEISIDNFSTNSTIDAILEDFNEYDIESSECNRPFHELNISCEPLNVTGKSYHNTLVQNNIVDVRVKRFQSSNIKNEKPKVIDKKVAEKAYEFTEENEKCEKLSSFRKKRLADKKYEFSEDNSENIVPFNSLRRERRFFKSTDLNNGLFLSPRSPGLRSPILSPNSRHGQFRSSPHYSKSPISPRDSARKFYVYSPSLDSDCSDSDSRLILRQPGIYMDSRIPQHSSGLLIVDSNRKDDFARFIKKAVRRYTSVDYFENSSLVSGQSKV